MSILSASPQDNRLFSAEIASKLGDINAAVIVQQLHYWMKKKEVGTIIGGVKYVYNSFNDWVKQFPWLSVWQFRKAMKLLRDLEIVKVIRYKAKCWNQINYYSLDCDRLIEYLNPKTKKASKNAVGSKKEKNAESTETVEMRDTTDREVNIQQIEVRDSTVSYNESKNTNQKETAESKEERSRSASAVPRSHLAKEEKIAAAPFENDVKGEIQPKGINTSQTKLNGLAGENKHNSAPCQRVVIKESNLGKSSIDVRKTIKTVNSKWRSLIEELDGIGVPINKTLINLVKMYSEEEVRRAIALIKIRKRDKHIPNLAGVQQTMTKLDRLGQNYPVFGHKNST